MIHIFNRKRIFKLGSFSIVLLVHRSVDFFLCMIVVENPCSWNIATLAGLNGMLYYVYIHLDASDDPGSPNYFHNYPVMKQHKKRSFGHLWQPPLWKYNVQDLSFSCWYFWHALICMFLDTPKEKIGRVNKGTWKEEILKQWTCAQNSGWFHTGFPVGAKMIAVVEGSKHLEKSSNIFLSYFQFILLHHSPPKIQQNSYHIY